MYLLSLLWIVLKGLQVKAENTNYYAHTDAKYHRDNMNHKYWRSKHTEDFVG